VVPLISGYGAIGINSVLSPLGTITIGNLASGTHVSRRPPCANNDLINVARHNWETFVLRLVLR
jgi:hypothetical protein